MRPEEVIAWREALTLLADQHFFDLIRMYIGAVRTPFNKQRLIEELSAFLRKAENRAAILDGLDELDIRILSAVVELPQATQQKIVSLFAPSRSFPEIYERVLNLEERLLIYRRGDTSTREYAINPLLSDDLASRIGMRFLTGPLGVGERVSGPVRVDDLSLAALYGFFLHSGETVKNDGSLRKKTLETLCASFPQLFADEDCPALILSAFRHLGLIVATEGILSPDQPRWEAFARLSNMERVAYLSAAAGGRFLRENLQRRAQLFLDFLESLDPVGRYDRETVSRLAFLLSEKRGGDPAGRAHGRFATMLRQRADQGGEEPDGLNADFAEVALSFGLIVETESGLARNSAVGSIPAGSALNPFLVVSPSFSVTLMPGFRLADLLPLVSCMEVRDVQIAGQFELTRKACAAAFDRGETAESLSALLGKWSSQDVPQNVLFSLKDWYRGYSSVTLYHGYVLRVDDGRRALFENDERLSSLIRKVLAPGVYLLSVSDPNDIQEAFADAGLDAAPAVSAPARQGEALPLPSLCVPQKCGERSGAEAQEGERAETSGPLDAAGSAPFAERQASLRAALDALSLPPDLADALASRIERRIVLVPSQLDPASVRVEKVEARDMDFLGKVRIAEYAIATGSLLEISLDERDGGRAILGRPVSTEKRTGDVLLKIAIEPDGAIEQVSLGRALLVRRIRGSIFSELPRVEK